MRIRSAGCTDVGLRRGQNEDAFFADDALGLYLVADGMGGHAGGEVASSLAASVTPRAVATSLRRKDPPAVALRYGLLSAHAAVLDRGAQDPRVRGMGSTTVALLIDRRTHVFLVGHVGDSRAYILRGGRLGRLTRDHSPAEEGRPLGSPRAVPESQVHVVTRALGSERNGQLGEEVGWLKAHVGDLVLLCSDGLTGVLSDAEIEELLRGARGLDRGCVRLIDAVNARGGPDNITAVLVRVLAS